MKAVILAGGLGTRISEETDNKPKPMIEIGGKPILWHIMKSYSASDVNDFIICCGYKGSIIKEYFANYFMHMSDLTFSMSDNEMKVHNKNAEHWNVTLIDTGLETMTGGRIKKIKKFVENEKSFCLTYGDGLSDIDIADSIQFHNTHNSLATVTAVYPPGRFGSLDLDGIKVKGFEEKPKGDGARINGGFFVLSPKVIDFIDGDKCVWEKEPMQKLALAGNMSAYLHDGFWQPMDTLRDKNYLEELWSSGKAPWKKW